MKLNDYKCAVCGHIHVDCESQPGSCQQCRHAFVEKIFPVPSITYNGPGFTGAQKDYQKEKNHENK